ncbi:MAG TPA: DUF72 domain-containing protein [Gemmatimonadales bacterium]|nr:DUF72 domain-containing protein [Gemmatimonadales bacterium]
MFYPPDLPARRWLEYASRQFNSIELNGTFYSLKSPAVFRRWGAETPGSGFVFAVKGSRFITHNLKLARAAGALANFYASGVLALGRKTGPFLWQLPATYRFDAERVEEFLRLLPRGTTAAARLARRHDRRLRGGVLTRALARLRYRHAFEVRHPSFLTREFYDQLEAHGGALVVADTAGTFPCVEELTADFVYVRLHGSRALYASAYTESELDRWATRVEQWAGSRGGRAGRDVYVYFDNDAFAHAPHNALALARRLGRKP